LCERAEALLPQALARGVGREVQQLRAEWKKLGRAACRRTEAAVERFDGACERAYAPAARHFAEQAAQHKQARKQREEFIAAAAAHAPTLLGEAPDWRAIERWLRDTTRPGAERAWAVSNRPLEATHARLKRHWRRCKMPCAARLQARQERGPDAEAEALAARATERDNPVTR